MKLRDRIEAFAMLGKEMRNVVDGRDETYISVCSEAYYRNNWFSKKAIDNAMMAWANVLTVEKLTSWMNRYTVPDKFSQKNIGLINAGNIPLVGLHDLIAVLISGHVYSGKNAFSGLEAKLYFGN